MILRQVPFTPTSGTQAHWRKRAAAGGPTTIGEQSWCSSPLSLNTTPLAPLRDSFQGSIHTTRMAPIRDSFREVVCPSPPWPLCRIASGGLLGLGWCGLLSILGIASKVALRRRLDVIVVGRRVDASVAKPFSYKRCFLESPPFLVRLGLERRSLAERGTPGPGERCRRGR